MLEGDIEYRLVSQGHPASDTKSAEIHKKNDNSVFGVGDSRLEVPQTTNLHN